MLPLSCVEVPAASPVGRVERDRLRERADVALEPLLVGGECRVDRPVDPAGEAAAVRGAVRVLARGREHHVRHALDAVDVRDLRVRAEHGRALARRVAEVGQHLLDQGDFVAVAELARLGRLRVVDRVVGEHQHVVDARIAFGALERRLEHRELLPVRAAERAERARQEHEPRSLVVERPVGLAELVGEVRQVLLHVVQAVRLVVARHVVARHRAATTGRACCPRPAPGRPGSGRNPRP